MSQKVFPLPQETGPLNGCFDMLRQNTVKEVAAMQSQTSACSSPPSKYLELLLQLCQVAATFPDPPHALSCRL